MTEVTNHAQVLYGILISDKEGSHHDDERGERRPERHHVESRKRHVLRADLNRQEIVAERGEWRVG